MRPNASWTLPRISSWGHARCPPGPLRFFAGAPAEVRTDVFERAWALLQSAQYLNLAPSALGPLADRSQTQRCVAVWLQHCIERRKKLTDVDHERGSQLG